MATHLQLFYRNRPGGLVPKAMAQCTHCAHEQMVTVVNGMASPFFCPKCNDGVMKVKPKTIKSAEPPPDEAERIR